MKYNLEELKKKKNEYDLSNFSNEVTEKIAKLESSIQSALDELDLVKRQASKNALPPQIAEKLSQIQSSTVQRSVNIPVTIDQGGTGATTASSALSNLGISLPVTIENGGTGQDTAQEAIDALTQVSSATNEHVLTKDTATGNAIFKASTGGYWTDSGTTLYLTTTTDRVVIGNSSPISSATLSVDGNTDQVQCIIQGHSTQTGNILEVQKSDGTKMLEVSNTGVTIGGTGSGISLTENSSIALDPAGSADGKYSGITVTGIGGATIAFGDLVTLDKDDSRWELVDISVAAAATGDARGLFGMAVTSSTDGGALTILLHGIIRADANFPALTIGAPVYASTTGDITVTQPTTTDHVIRIVGYAMTADELYFNPGNSWTTHT